MNLDNVFGVNVKRMFEDAFRAKYEPMLGTQFSGKTGFTFVMLDQSRLAAARADWANPLRYMMLSCVMGPEEQSTGSGGTFENVLRKMRFVLRTGKPSLEAEVGRAGTHLVLPGDYPWQGAGPYRGQIVGTSGLKKQDDWSVSKGGVNMLLNLEMTVRSAAVLRADQLSEYEDLPSDVRIKAKYLQGIDVSDMFPKYKAA